jgi:hypothetical protein
MRASTGAQQRSHMRVSTDAGQLRPIGYPPCKRSAASLMSGRRMCAYHSEACTHSEARGANEEKKLDSKNWLERSSSLHQQQTVPMESRTTMDASTRSVSDAVMEATAILKELSPQLAAKLEKACDGLEPCHLEMLQALVSSHRSLSEAGVPVVQQQDLQAGEYEREGESIAPCRSRHPCMRPLLSPLFALVPTQCNG